MKTEFNHAANDSPRSGSTKKIAPVVGVAIVTAIGPAGVDVTVGSGHRDRYPDREVVRERDYRDRDETVVIKRGRDHDYDRDRKTVIIDRDR
jgi:hypothetical protein